MLEFHLYLSTLEQSFSFETYSGQMIKFHLAEGMITGFLGMLGLPLKYCLTPYIFLNDISSNVICEVSRPNIPRLIIMVKEEQREKDGKWEAQLAFSLIKSDLA